VGYDFFYDKIGYANDVIRSADESSPKEHLKFGFNNRSISNAINEWCAMPNQSKCHEY
jgi:hypothetical protein